MQHTSEGYTGRAVTIDTYRRQPRTVEGWLRDAGFMIEATLVMRPDGDKPGVVIFGRCAPDPVSASPSS